jgi:hypothetical protein
MPTFNQVNRAVSYSQSYRESIFNIWYQAECPPITELVKIIPADNDGRMPDLPTVGRWRREDGWDEHADALNGQLAVKTDQIAINERLEMFQKHAELGKELSQRGKEYLEQHGLDTGAEAIRAIVEGTDLERKSIGYAELYKKIINASDDELNDMLKKYLGDGKVIDGEVKDVDANKSEPNS